MLYLNTVVGVESSRADWRGAAIDQLPETGRRLPDTERRSPNQGG